MNSTCRPARAHSALLTLSFDPPPHATGRWHTPLPPRESCFHAVLRLRRFFAYVLRARPRLPEDLRFANQNGFAALNRTLWRDITMQPECQSCGFRLRSYLSRSYAEFTFLHAAISMSNKRFLQKFVLRFSTKIFCLYELVIKWSAEPKDKRSTRQTRKGGFGVSLPVE